MATLNIRRALTSNHPLESPRIRAIAQTIVGRPLTDSEIDRLWSVFSEDRHAGDGWLPVIDESLIDFESWLRL